MSKQCQGGETSAKENFKIFLRFWLSAQDFDTLRETSQLIVRRKPRFVTNGTLIGTRLIACARRYVGISIPRNCESQFLYNLANALS
jgi:hypothetical protein